jgi:hypothetical protein
MFELFVSKFMQMISQGSNSGGPRTNLDRGPGLNPAAARKDDAQLPHLFPKPPPRSAFLARVSRQLAHKGLKTYSLGFIANFLH